MVRRKTSLAIQIEQDLSRTFPTLAFFNEDGGPFRQALQDMLEAFSLFRPGLGYVQGMSHVAAMLLLYLDRDDAFTCLCNMLHDHQVYPVLRSEDPELLSRHLAFFDLLLEENIPHLQAHFTDLGLRPDMFIFNWTLTLFTKTLPLDASARIWDCYLFHDAREAKERFLWRAVLALLKCLDVKVRACTELDEALAVLNNVEELDMDKFFVYLDTIELSSRRYDASRRRVGLNGGELTASSTNLSGLVGSVGRR